MYQLRRTILYSKSVGMDVGKMSWSPNNLVNNISPPPPKVDIGNLGGGGFLGRLVLDVREIRK